MDTDKKKNLTVKELINKLLDYPMDYKVKIHMYTPYPKDVDHDPDVYHVFLKEDDVDLWDDNCVDFFVDTKDGTKQPRIEEIIHGHQ